MLGTPSNDSHSFVGSYASDILIGWPGRDTLEGVDGPGRFMMDSVNDGADETVYFGMQ